MAKISNLKIRTKIILMVLPPVLGLLLISLFELRAQWQSKDNSQSLINLTNFMDGLSSLLHETQKERGLTAIYLNSGGKKVSAELNSQLKVVELKEKKMQELEASLNIASFDKSLSQAWLDIGKQLEQKTEMEGKVTKLEVDTKTATGYFTQLNAKILYLIGISTKVSNDVVIARELSAFYNFLQAKEKTGLERAIAVEGFQLGHFEDALFDKYNRIKTEQALSFYNFQLLASAEENKLFEEHIISHSSNQAVEDFKKLIVRQDKIEVNADDWFKAITSKIDQLNVMSIALSSNIKADAQSLFSRSQTMLICIASICLVILGICVVLVILISNTIISGIKNCVEFAKTMSAGDFSNKINISSNDEIREFARSFNTMNGSLSAMISQIRLNGETLASSSEELSTVSGKLLNASKKTSVQCDGVASATEQMSTNINTIASAVEEMSTNTGSVSSAAEQMSQNISAIASAVEEMSSSIGGIGLSSKENMKVAEDAMKMADAATTTMNVLGEAAKEIGQVTDTIKSIAEKTDLLALNATIEAASAGDAGKGFAVVANEIKGLAIRSAQAAADIANRIGGVQKKAVEAVNVIEKVSAIIGKINDSVKNITQSVEEQTTVSNEIASNVGQANSGIKNIAESIGEIAKGANDISKNVGEASKGAKDVSANILGVNQNVATTNIGAEQVNTSASDLSKVASELKTLVDKFKINVTR